MSDSAPPSSHAVLADLYGAAVAAVAPGPALTAALDRMDGPHLERPWLIALGKAALPMAEAAVAALQTRGRVPAGGLVVAPAAGPAPHPSIQVIEGDHPEPGPRSAAAAERLAATVASVGRGDDVWVLLSGGTTSLVGAPVAGVTAAELSALYTLLLGSGLDIAAMNRIRKRFARWGGGRLARALDPARMHVFVVSDVIGDDLAAIGSGPCVPDPTTATDIRLALASAQLWERIPESMHRLVSGTERGEIAETPKSHEPTFGRVSTQIVASNRLAVEATAKRAAELGVHPELVDSPLAGEAAAVGRRVAAALVNNAAHGSTQPAIRRCCIIWGGETTVSLSERAGLGGRCQELALSAAQVLDGARSGVALLAAGTDGRDGPTDAAGAIVDGRTWRAMSVAGRDPAADLAAHNAYPALAAAGALLKPGLTGTNVMDVVIGLRG